MAAKKRTEDQIESDKLYITDMFVRNVPIRTIATNVNNRSLAQGFDYQVTFQQIAYDIKKILETWKEERNEQIDHMVEIELAKLDKIEAECWIAWEASKVGKVKTKVDGGVQLGTTQTPGQVIERIIETSVGDVRFLDRIQACIDKRIDLLGLEMPKKIKLSGDAENPLYIKDEERSAEIERLMKVLKLKEDGTPGSTGLRP